MGWSTKFSKTQITEALHKGQNSRIVNNGWARLSSSIANPTNLGTLVTPGNYITSYWTDGPSLGEDHISHLNIVVTLINGVTHQFINAGEKRFHREMAANTTIYGNWSTDFVEGSTNPGPNEPANPVNSKTIWLDTSNPDVPSLKLFVNGTWKEIIPEESMKSAIYDSHGRRTDIFKYIDTKISEASLGSMAKNFKDHVNNTDIHISASEKESWNNTPTVNDVNTAVNNMNSALQTVTEDAITQTNNKTNTLLNSIDKSNKAINTHTSNALIHPTLEKQYEWDNKSAADHKHEFDNNVTININRVNGVIPSSLLPYDVKERAYVVSSISEMLQLRKNPVHNGDLICVETQTTVTWYFVIDDSKLGTASAEAAFKKIRSNNGFIDWSDVANKPTTISGYGITDSATKKGITDAQAFLTDVENNISAHNYDTAGDLKTFYENSLAELKSIDASLPTVLEEPVAALEKLVGI